MKLRITCPVCNGKGWPTPCDCDPDGLYHCEGQGTCGTQPCPECDGGGEVLVDLNAFNFVKGLHSPVRSDLLSSIEDVLNNIVEEPLTAERVAEWLKWVGEEDCEIVRLALSKGKNQRLFEALLLHGLHLRRNRAKSLLREPTLLDPVPDLTLRPALELGEMTREDLEELVSDLHAVIVIKDEGLRKQSSFFDPPVQQEALKRALNATPEMAKGIVERLRQEVSELKDEAWSWKTAHQHEAREHRILRKALHERIDLLERSFRKANFLKRHLKTLLEG